MPTKFTPGPWHIGSISQERGDIGIRPKEGRFLIAEVTNAASFGDMLVGSMRRGDVSFQPSDATTQFANAYLITAAPELYAVLVEVSDWISNWDPSFTQDDEWPDAKARIVAALAKARGEPT